MVYVLYGSQAWQLEEKPHYAGTPNYYKGMGPDLMGLPFIINTDKLVESMVFNLKSQCRALIKNKKLTGYKIIPLNKATALSMEYKNARKKRTEKYRMTEEEKKILWKFEEFKG